jgi:hypothetical protein
MMPTKRILPGFSYALQDLSNHKLTGDGTGSDFQDTDLAGADLTEVTGLNREQIEEAANWERARLPRYLSGELHSSR